MPCVNVYDLETTGLEPAYDVPLQFAAIVYNQRLDELKRINLRGRPPRHVLPGPKALLVTGQSIETVVGQPLSHYDLIGKIEEHFSDHSPAIITTFNGLRYDEEVLRHSFYGTLRPPYQTQFNGNERFDILRVAHATVACNDSALRLPINSKGKQSFKLEDLAPENGFTDHVAHDALGDVEATMFIARHIRDKAPEVWNAAITHRSKNLVHELMELGEPLLQVDWNYRSNKPLYRLIQPVAKDQLNKNEWLCVNLDCNISTLLSRTSETLVSRFKSAQGLLEIVRIKANAQPLIFPLDSPAIANIAPSVDFDKVAALKADLGFPDRLKDAAVHRREGFVEPTCFREKLYSGGFFPTDDDQAKFDAFHQALPRDRYDILQSFTDTRAREIGFWLVGSEWPEAMPRGERTAYEDRLREHLTAQDAKWTTIPGALNQIEELRSQCTQPDHDILDQYEAYLRSILNRGTLLAAE